MDLLGKDRNFTGLRFGKLSVNSDQIANGTMNVNEILGLAKAKSAELRPLLTRPHTGARVQ